MPRAKPKAAVPKKENGVKAKGESAKNHPVFAIMIERAISELNNKKGSSRAAILKYIVQNYDVADDLVMVNVHLRQALIRGVANDRLVQVKGIGASGSFRLAPKTAESASKSTAARKKAAAKS